MSNFSISSPDFREGEEIPKKFGYKFENAHPTIEFDGIPQNTKSLSIIMDDPDAMVAVGKIWVHWLLSDLSPQTVAILSGETPMKTLREGEDDDEMIIQKEKLILVRLVMVDLHHLMDVIHTSSKDTHLM